MEKKKKKRIDWEHRVQVQALAALALAFPYAHERIFAIPNGSHRNIITAKKLKMEGVRAGVPDLFLPLASSRFYGLFIEMKVSAPMKTYLAAHQKEERDALLADGYAYSVCRSSCDLLDVVDQYLAGEWKNEKMQK